MKKEALPPRILVASLERNAPQIAGKDNQHYSAKTVNTQNDQLKSLHKSVDEKRNVIDTILQEKHFPCFTFPCLKGVGPLFFVQLNSLCPFGKALHFLLLDITPALTAFSFSLGQLGTLCLREMGITDIFQKYIQIHRIAVMTCVS